jgi:iron complex transport system substrate-binding protein
MPLDLEKIISLRPDLIFTEEGITSASDLARMRELKIPVVSFSYRKVRDVLAAMDSIRLWTSAGPVAAKLCDSLRLELNTLENRAQNIPASARKAMLALTWTDPVFAYGAETWMSDKMRLAGGKNALDNPLGKLYPQLEREQLLKLNPDVLFGGTFEKMDSTFFRMYPELREMKAYQNRQIFELDDDLASRPGPRFLDGIREMNRLIAF